MHVMRIVGLVRGVPTLNDGEFLVAYDPEPRPDNTIFLKTTKDVKEARRFKSATEAMECWKQASKTHPIRPDGRPNRPLTAFSVEVEPA